MVASIVFGVIVLVAFVALQTYNAGKSVFDR
jgi:hypothetical protein